MDNKSLIPEGFKDHVDFNTNVEHEYKNKIIDIFISNGFDLVKAPLLEFYQKNSDNVFIIESKKKEPKLFLRDDITPQIIRITSSRYKNKIRPIKKHILCLLKFFNKNKTQTKSSKIMILIDILKKPSFKTFNLSGIIIKKNSDFLLFSQK